MAELVPGGENSLVPTFTREGDAPVNTMAIDQPRRSTAGAWTRSTAPDGETDAALTEAVRRGDLAKFDRLYRRHRAAAYNLARQLSRGSADADDLVAEAFIKVLDALRAGGGPGSAFRAYLFTALRHTAYDKTKRDRRVELADDVTAATGVRTELVSEPFTDTVIARLERSLAAGAFAKLPERWQAVLWHTEIEDQTPAAVAPTLELTPNAVSALAYRAREGLRQAYLQMHLGETMAPRCRWTTDRLGVWTRGGLSKRDKTTVEAHLNVCGPCRHRVRELADTNATLPRRSAA